MQQTLILLPNILRFMYVENNFYSYRAQRNKNMPLLIRDRLNIRLNKEKEKKVYSSYTPTEHVNAVHHSSNLSKQVNDAGVI